MITPAFELYQPYGATRDHPTELMVTESQLQKGFIDFDPKALDYVKRENDRLNGENTGQMYLSYKLRELQSKWEEETAFTSSIREIVENDNFKAIISFGEDMVPLILQSLMHKPSHLVWTLNFITGRTISSKPISVSDASKAWVAWGLENKLI